MGFDRSKFKATKLDVIKEQEKEQEKLKPHFGNDGGPGFHKLDEDGDYKMRVYPFHPDGGGESFNEVKMVSFLPIRQLKRGKDGKEIKGQYEVKRKPIFNSKVHGGLDKDLVEEYMQYVKKHILPIHADDETRQKEIWNAVTGRDGVKPQETWPAWADMHKDGKIVFALWEIKKSIKSQMVELAATMATDDDISSPDPYSDVEDGICVIVTRDSVAGKEDASKWYKARLDTKIVDKFNTQLIPTPLSDEQLEEFLKADSLHKKFRNAFTAKDFDLQLKGLQRLDEENKINAFADDAWLDICEELSSLVPEPVSESAPEQATAPVETAAVTEEPLPTAKVVVKTGLDLDAPETTTVEVTGDTNTVTVTDEPEAPSADNVKNKLAALRKKIGKS